MVGVNLFLPSNFNIFLQLESVILENNSTPEPKPERKKKKSVKKKKKNSQSDEQVHKFQ